MFFHARRAPVTATATDVDFAGDAPSHPRAIRLGRALHDAHELVTGHAGEARVAIEQLQVGAADTGHADADAALTVAVGDRSVAQGQCTGGVHHEGFHRSRS